MIKSLDVFFEMPCLTEQSQPMKGILIQKKWLRSADKRVIGQYLQKFIDYNKTQFEFLDVQPYIIGTDQNTSLIFRSSGYIGTIPLRASDTGKQIGDFVVVPRFSGSNRFEDYIDIINLLGAEISPEISDSLPLASGKNFRPPLYLEALKFIISLEELIKNQWQKFDNKEVISNQPYGQINWNKYVLNEFKVENKLRFPVKKNILSEFHSEYSEIRYVYDICRKELLSANTPKRIKNTINIRLNFLQEKLYLHQPKQTNNISFKTSDTIAIYNCKFHANKILNYNLVESTAWRVDFADVFEKFIQFLFREVSSEIGGKLYSNFKFNSKSSHRYSWELKHIEPDAIYQKDSILVFVDAKYKSNLYNKFEKSDKLKEDHRFDLHQIMAYSSFSKSTLKYCILCYPSNKVEVKKIEYKNSINEVINTVLIFGIPLRKDVVKEAKFLLISELDKLLNINFV